MSTFNAITQELIDLWLKSDELTSAESLYVEISDRLSLKMALSVVTTEADDPYEWRFRRVRDFGFKSHLLTQMKKQFPDAVLRELDRSFIDNAIIPAYSRALEIGRPTLELVRTKLLGVRIGYERLILPQKAKTRPGWCVSIVEGRFFVPPAIEAKTDFTDDNIIQLLIEGQSTKEIAEALHLSPRTIEHRVDKLKDRFDARNLVHLVAKLVAMQISRRDGDSL